MLIIASARRAPRRPNTGRRPGRYTSDDTADNAADGVALLLDIKNQFLHPSRGFGIRTSHRIAFGERKVEFSVGTADGYCADLRSIGLYADAQLLQSLTSESSSHDTGSRLACARASASAIVTQTVLCCICIVGMRRAESLAELSVVTRLLVLVADYKADGTACGHSLKQSREYFDRITLLAAGSDGRLSRRRRSSSRCTLSRSMATPAGMPSITPPIAAPWLSPKPVNVNILPVVFIFLFLIVG